MRYLAVDYGGKRIGLASCDRDEMVVSPLKMLIKSGSVISDICSIIQEYEIESVVIGLPYNMDGTEGDSAKKVRNFGLELEKAVNIPVYFHDERLSSFGAEKKLIARELTRKGKKKRLDAVAAAEILKDFLGKNT